MKIIKQGNIKKKVGRKTCKECNTLFEYEKSDVKHGSSGMDAEPCKWVVCPLCKEQIDVNYSDWYKIDK